MRKNMPNNTMPPVRRFAPSRVRMTVHSENSEQTWWLCWLGKGRLQNGTAFCICTVRLVLKASCIKLSCCCCCCCCSAIPTVGSVVTTGGGTKLVGFFFLRFVAAADAMGLLKRQLNTPGIPP